MKNLKNLITITLCLIAGCSTPHPTAPTSPKPSSFIPAAQMTSRVNPADFDIDEREYCDAAGTECWWETDYYTVERPDVCPIDPIP